MINTLFLLLAWLLTVVNSVFAQGDLSCDDIIDTIYNQSNISFYSTCPVLQALFYIDHSFSGPFELPGVKSLGSFSSGYLGPEIKGDNRTEDRVTSISMPDLENTTSGGVLMAYLDNLANISFPKLQTISGDLVINSDDKVKILTFPALSNITGGSLLWGDFDKIHLPSLKTISFLQVQSTGNLDCLALGKNLSSITFTPKEYDAYKGFTCWTPDEANTYNSSANSAPSQSSTSGSSSASSTGAASPTTSTKSSGARNMGFFKIVRALSLGIVVVALGLL